MTVLAVAFGATFWASQEARFRVAEKSGQRHDRGGWAVLDGSTDLEWFAAATRCSVWVL